MSIAVPEPVYPVLDAFALSKNHLNADLTEINSNLSELSKDIFLVTKTITIRANTETVIDITDVLPSGVNHWMLIHAQVGTYPMPYITFTHESPTNLLQVTTIDYTDSATKVRFQSSVAWNMLYDNFTFEETAINLCHTFKAICLM